MEMRLSTMNVREQDVRETWTTQVELVARQDMAGLEKKLCEYVGMPYCVSVESATTGMLLALKACGVDAGDYVLCTSFSYFATAEIVALAGAKPLLVDINPNTFNIDPYCLEYVIGKCIRTRQPIPRALIAVDLFGLPCNYEAIGEICERYGVAVIEDMAQAFGAEFQGKRAGGFGRMAVASFFPAKPLDEIGEGGAIFCSEREDARRLQSLRRVVRMRESQLALYHTGSYMDTVTASIVAEKLETLEFELECRKAVVGQYRMRLQGTVRMQQIGEEYESAYTQFVIALPSPDMRMELIEYLRQRHIPCQTFDPSPLRRRNGYCDWGKGALVNAKSVAQKILALPVHPYLSRRVVDYICDCVKQGIEALENKTE